MARRKIKQQDAIKRKDDLDPTKDEFVTKATSILDWAYERRRPIGLILGIALLMAIVGIALNSMMEESKAEASTVLGKGLEAALAPVIPPSEEDMDSPPRADDDRLFFETGKARATETIKRFDEAMGKASAGTDVVANLGKAAAYLDLGEPDKAAELYQKVLASKGTPTWLTSIATEGLGLALEAKGDLDSARAKFDELMGKAKGADENLAKYNAGRLAQKQGDKEKAAELFKAIVDSYDEREHSRLNFFFVQARERLLEVDPDADVPALPSSGMGGLDGIDPELLQQLLQARAQQGAS